MLSFPVAPDVYRCIIDYLEQRRYIRKKEMGAVLRMEGGLSGSSRPVKNTHSCHSSDSVSRLTRSFI